MPSDTIEAIVVWVEEKEKKKKLHQLLTQSKYYRPPMLVFVDNKMGAQLLAQSITKVIHYNI